MFFGLGGRGTLKTCVDWSGDFVLFEWFCPLFGVAACGDWGEDGAGLVGADSKLKLDELVSGPDNRKLRISLFAISSCWLQNGVCWGCFF